MNATTIKNITLTLHAPTWVAEDGDLDDLVKTGTPHIDVYVHTGRDSYSVTVTTCVEIVCVDGGTINSEEEPRILASRQRLPRWALRQGGTEKYAKWLVGRHYGTDHGLPVDVRLG